MRQRPTVDWAEEERQPEELGRLPDEMDRLLDQDRIEEALALRHTAANHPHLQAPGEIPHLAKVAG